MTGIPLIVEGIVGQRAWGPEMNAFERGERIGSGLFALVAMVTSVVKGVRGMRGGGKAVKSEAVSTPLPKPAEVKIPKHRYVPGRSKVAKMARRTAKRDAKKAAPKPERKIGKRAKEKALNQGKHSFNGLTFNRKSCPIKIPKTAKVIEQIKTGYTQVKFIWIEGGKKFEARWHTRTPGAPLTQGDTWVVLRETFGNSSGARNVQHVLVGKNTWVSKANWENAGVANRSGAATPEQLSILENGHHSAY